MLNKDFLVYRIMKGRLSFRRDGLSLFIKEPDPDLLYRSIDIYESAFDRAYGSGVYLKNEMLELMYERDFYSPFDDMDMTKLKKDLEELKLQAFKNFRNQRQLQSLKYLIRQTEDRLIQITKKRYQFDHLTCEGVASYAQWNWIIENSTYYTEDETLYDWNKISIGSIVSIYENAAINSSDFRAIARSDAWRPIWALGKKTGNLFARPSCSLTKDQITLTSLSMMYDSVYESTESPPEKVIEDDDCLDGWFIEQRKKHDRNKLNAEADNLITNKKIANSGEIFVMANSDEEADFVDSLNTTEAKNIKHSRLNQLKRQGEVNSDMEFLDMRLNTQMENNRAIMEKAQGN
jgi:hypothetical protein